MILELLTVNELFAYLLIFCRIGMALMLLPGIGEMYVSPRVRVMFALGMSLVLTPILGEFVPPYPSSMVLLLLYICGELLIGAFLGSVVKFMMVSIHIAGTIISHNIGLAAATLFDPNSGAQGSVVGGFLSLLATTLLFVLDLHHLYLYGMIESYQAFAPGEAIPTQDFAFSMGRLLADGFASAMKIGAPHIILGMLMYLLAGVFSRVMPQMQIFFVIIPLQVWMGLFIFLATFSMTIMWYMGGVEQNMHLFFTSLGESR